MEVWKDVVGYEGLYQVSNIGNVYSCRQMKSLHPANSYSNGYSLVLLYKDGTRKMKGVHRLVAEAFIPNPNNLPIVDHKDGNKRNNCISNLEWVTQKENVRRCIEKGQFSKMKNRNK